VRANPFAACRAPRDTTPAWEKRIPYADDEIAALLQAATDPADRELVLLVRRGKGSKQRVVALSASLRQALHALGWREDGYVLPYRTAGSA
jgi:hypothetical protein